MITDGQRLLNAVNKSTDRWRKQGFQRRFSVTDLHGVEYQSTMTSNVPAQFYTSISYDFDKFAHWWFKVIVRPYGVKTALKEGGGTKGSAFGGDSKYTGGPINYGGNTLSAEHIQAILDLCSKYNLLPSGIIVQLYLESNWGNSAVGRADNNWSGMTGSAGTRPSGVTVTTGSARPSAEGGTYMHYNSVEDFLTDYMYLLGEQTEGNNQKMYNVAGKTEFDDFVKGLFREGGALFDYASAGYTSYLSVSKDVRAGINTNNDNILDKIDAQLLQPTDASGGSNGYYDLIDGNAFGDIIRSHWDGANGNWQPHVARVKRAIAMATNTPEDQFITYAGHQPDISLAVDFMTNDNYRLGDTIAAFLIENIDQLNIDYIIWGQKFYMNVNNIYGPANVWSLMPDRGNKTQNHGDHVHVSFKPTDSMSMSTQFNSSGGGGNSDGNNNRGSGMGDFGGIVGTASGGEPDGPTGSPETATKTMEVLGQLDSLKGTTLGNGECYGLVAWYSMQLGGVGLGGGIGPITHAIGDTMSASNIGVGYDWASVGWKVVPTSKEAMRVGAIFTETNQYSPYGHTGVIKAINGDTVTTLEQNVSGQRFVVERQRTMADMLSGGRHLIYPPEIANGKGIGNTDGSLTRNYVQQFAKDIKIKIDGIDFTPMFKAQYDGAWIDKYSVFPDDKPNHGYDVMLGATALTEEQRKKIFRSGEHLVEITGSMQADVILRTYLKYNHLN